MEDKLSLLRDYGKNVKIIPCEQVERLGTDNLPVEWLNILKEESERIRVEKTLDIWDVFVPNDLRKTISYLKENLINVELITNNDKYNILYSVRVGDGDIDFYEGGVPKQNFSHPALKAAWSKIPQSIKHFYENLHDGFYYYASGAMGLVPLEEVTFFADDEWGIIEELKGPLQIDLKTTFGFFKTGMGGYVAIDYKNSNNDNATLWFTDEEPKYNVNFWDIVDEWLVLGFE